MSQSSDPHDLPHRFRTLAFVGHGTNDLYWFILPIVLPMMLSRYRLRFAGGGTLLSIYLLVVALSSLLAGRLSDRLDPWRMIGLGFLLASLGFAASAFSAPLPLFVLSLVIAAVGVSVFHPAMYGTITNTIVTGQARFFAAFESWGCVTIAVMFVAVGLILRALSWKTVLLLIAMPGLVAGVVFLFQPRPMARPSFPIPARKSPPGILLAAYLTSNMLRFFAITGVLSFVPTYLVYQIDLAPETAAYAGSVFFAGGILGTRLAGFLAVRHSPYRVMLAGLLALGPLVFLFGIFSSLPMLVIVLFVLGFSAMVCVPLQSLLLRDFGPHLGTGEIFGIMMAGITVMQALGPAAFGVAADAIGLARTMQLFSLPAVASWILLLALTGSRYVREHAEPSWREAANATA